MKKSVDLEAVSRVSKLSPYLVAAIFFGIVYVCSLSLVYVEGDDAASVVFHALGRNVNLQPPYSPYHGMMDIFLGLLPASEMVVRSSAILMSAVFSVVMVALIIRLISDLLPDLENWKLSIVSVAMLLCIPEIFYLSITYTPSIFAMSFVLAAHLVIVTAFRRFLAGDMTPRTFFPAFILSVGLFSVGVACRWDIGVYVLFIVADLVSSAWKPGKLAQGVKLGLLWGIFAFSASLAAIVCTGYGIQEIQFTLNLARTEITSRDSWFATVGAYQSFFTPGFVVFGAAGLAYFARSNRNLVLLTLLGAIPVAPYLFSREPKMLLPAIPAMCLAIAAGVNLICFAKSHRKYLRLAKVASLIILVLPWLIGIQFNSTDTLWGPGFEVRTLSADNLIAETGQGIADRVAGRTVSISNYGFGFAGGFAIPTPEGPRPLGGHAFVLFNSEWRDLMVKLDNERRATVELAMFSNLNILQDEANSYLLAKLLEMGSTTTDPRDNLAPGGINQRSFPDKLRHGVNIQILKIRKSLFEQEQIEKLLELNPSRKVILYSGYSSTLKRLSEVAPKSILPLGPYSAIVDLDALHQAISEKP